MSERTRAPLNLDDDDEATIDLSSFAPSNPSPRPDKAAVKAVSEASGFPSREAGGDTPAPAKTRSRRRVSPYKAQLGVRCRPEVKAIFQDLSDRLDQHDHTTFEEAVRAILLAGGYGDLLERFEDVTGRA